jgi:hypothetical protein
VLKNTHHHGRREDSMEEINHSSKLLIMNITKHFSFIHMKVPPTFVDEQEAGDDDSKF